VHVPSRIVEKHLRKEVISPLPKISPYIQGHLIAPNFEDLSSHGTLSSFMARRNPTLRTAEEIKRYREEFPDKFKSPKHPPKNHGSLRLDRTSTNIRVVQFKKDIIPPSCREFIAKGMGARSVPADESYGGKIAITKFTMKQVLWNKGIALYDIHLLTGRYHQLRVHFSESAFPIHGDPLYSPPQYEQFQNSPMALQSYHLSFTNPLQKEKISVTLSEPEFFKDLMNET